MVNLLEMAMVAARDLPPEMQGDIMRLILAYPGDEAPSGSDADGNEAPDPHKLAVSPDATSAQ